MVVARSTSRSVATTTLNKAPKVKSAKDVVDDRQLAEDVDRVLRISQPKEAALRIKPRRPDASTVASSSKPRAHSPATKVVKPAIPPASNKGKEKATPNDERSPWKAERLSSAERAKAAMQAINDGIKSLNQAVQAGYRHGSGKRIEEWTEQRVMAAVETCEEALRSLRVQEEKGELGSKGIEVERAAQGLVGKCLGLAMHRRALDQLVVARPRILRLYSPVNMAVISTPTSAKPTLAPPLASPFRSSRSVPSKYLTSRPSRKLPVDQPKIVSKPPPAAVALPQDWLDLAWLPERQEETKLDEVVKGVIFQAIAGAWIALLGLGDERAFSAILRHPLPNPVIGPSRLHPFQIALFLPRQTTTPLLHLLYRSLWSADIPHSTTYWLQLRLAALIALSITVSSESDAGPSSKHTPAQLWDSARRTLGSKEITGEYHDRHRASAEAIGALVEWTEEMLTMRKEDMAKWFEGKEWLGLLEMWIGFGRRLGDAAIIDKALSLMTTSTSMTSPHAPKVTPSTPGSSSQVSRKSIKGMGKAGEAEAEVARLCGDLAKTSLTLDKLFADTSCLAEPAAESSLRSSDLSALTEVLLSLSNDETGKAALGKAARAVERVRRTCSKILDRLSKSEAQAGVATLDVTIRQWLVAGVELVEDLLQTSAMDLSASAFELVAGAIDSLLALSRAVSPLSSSSSAQQSPLTHLDRASRICDLARPHCKSSDLTDWLKCLSSAAYNIGVTLWKEGSAKGSLPFVGTSCEWGKRALSEMVEQKMETVALNGFREGLVKKYELLAWCYQKTEDRPAALGALIDSVINQANRAEDQLLKAAATNALGTVFEQHTELNPTLSRISQMILFDPPALSDQINKLFQEKAVAAAGIVGERLIHLLKEGEYRPDVASTMIGIGEAVLGNYKPSEFPIRRMRTIVSIMSVIIAAGVSQDRFAGLMEEIDKLNNSSNVGEDQGLAHYRREYTGTAMLLSALQAYHTHPEATLAVGNLADQAFQELRQLAIPPTTAPESAIESARTKKPLQKTSTVRAPVRATPRGMSRVASASRILKKQGGGKPGTSGRFSTHGTPLTLADYPTSAKRFSDVLIPTAFDDLKRLARLLASLSSLLGLLGHALPKIQALKLLRAMLRGRDDFDEEYIVCSSQLGIEYSQLGKYSRASSVFSQAIRAVSESKREESAAIRVELHLRFSQFLAMQGDQRKGGDHYTTAEALSRQIVPLKSTTFVSRVMERVAHIQRAILARSALAGICAAEGNAAGMTTHLSAGLRLSYRAADCICRLAPRVANSEKTSTPPAVDDPFSALPQTAKGHEEPAKDDVPLMSTQMPPFAGKHLYGLQLQVAEGLVNATFDIAAAFAQRGSVKDCDYFLKQGGILAKVLRSSAASARVVTQIAQLRSRMRCHEDVAEKLGEASTALVLTEGPDAVDLQRIRGDIFMGQRLAQEAELIFASASKDVRGLDAAFIAIEALIPSPRKSVTSAFATSICGEEPLLPNTVAHLLRQQAWILQEAGSAEDCEQLLLQAKNLSAGLCTKADDFFLDGRIGLFEAFKHFKTDLFMSSLTESTIAMPMGKAEKAVKDRQSSRQCIELTLHRSERAFLSALTMASGTGRVEEVRQACLSLALLRAFQTSLGQGSPIVTASAAGILASSSAITLQREMLEAIDGKFMEIGHDDLEWPRLESWPLALPKEESGPRSPVQHGASANLADAESDSESERTLRTYWEAVRAKYAANGFVTGLVPDLGSLPSDWAVVSISVTDDRNTMFVSRHQKGHEPIVFCLPLDRQGRREGDDDLFTFDAAVAELADIIRSSDEGARAAKSVEGPDGKAAWWANRKALDKRMEELLSNLEFCWLGAFKTILHPRSTLTPAALNEFRSKLEKIFLSALAGSGPELKKGARAELNNELLECFATLSSKCRDEEIEDLVYFILDMYQFHGVPVALAELDIDQIGLDVKGALTELELASATSTPAESPEHLFLALDKNVAGFPWESIPTLRARPISRIPSLPFLLDQVAMGRHLAPAMVDGRRTVDTRKVFYILTPTSDLARTQAHFEPWISQMVAKAGWKGIVGRAPTELEMIAALKDYDLVLYFGHGSGEQYIRSHKIRHLPKCATTMLWGCSSGLLRDQGDLDRTGTACHYMVAGCPSLVANLWDVTDRDIDRLSEEVFKKLHLDASHVPDESSASPGLLPISNMSTVAAVNASRDACKLKYLTGAAPVVYGIPVYLH